MSTVKRETERALQFVDDTAPGMEHAVTLMAAYATARLREELTALAREAEIRATSCGHSKLCHKVEAEAIRARLSTLESEEKE